MGKSKIEWTDRVWNPITGCTKVSPGCQNCYAERMSKRLAGRCGYPKDEPFKVTMHEDRLQEPLRWTKPSRVFVCSMSDLFHQDVPDSFIEEIFAIMSVAQQHTFLVLTKRPERMKKWFSDNRSIFVAGAAQQLGHKCLLPDITMSEWWPLKNVWLGVTAENQEQADRRIPILLQIPAAVRFVSVEPMLGPVSLAGFDGKTYRPWLDSIAWKVGIDWVICGGESGPGARPMHPNWARNLRDQCQAAGVPYFFKQHGEWIQVGECMNESDDNKFYNLTSHNYPSFRRVNHAGGFGYHGAGSIYMQKVGKKKAGRLLDGVEYNEMPGLGQ